MSRALDKYTAAKIESGNLQAVYDDLVRALFPATASELMEIEILGTSHALPAGCNVLVDGNSIAFPKTTVVQGFIVARQILFQCLPKLPEKQQEIRNAAAIVLLMDPEHITAANARKRVIQLYRERPAEELKAELASELWWVNSLLTARLHRHTKSPTLWSHRRWVLEVCQSAGMLYDINRDLTNVILVAGERHARNYYAWLHLRWVALNLLLKIPNSGETNVDSFDGPKLLATIKTWCLRHPDDTAGFSFLMFCLLEHPEGFAGGTSSMDASSSMCKSVLDLAVSFKWTNESVWVFLRTIVASGVAEEQRTAFFESIKFLLEARTGNAKTLSTLQAAHDWCLKYEKGATRG
jgi:protein prenyltransferase alpha subunit repeat containing protein 1